jgi:hypothetical protein
MQQRRDFGSAAFSCHPESSPGDKGSHSPGKKNGFFDIATLRSE